MSPPSPFYNEEYLRRIEANDPDHDVSIRISIPLADEVSYELFDRVGRALANNTSIRELWLIAPEVEHKVDLAGWVHFLELIGENCSITRFRYTSTYNKYTSTNTAKRARSVNTARALRHVLERIDALEDVTISSLHRGEVEEFASALASRGTALRILRISEGDIGDDGAEAIAEYLESANNIGIDALQLSWNYLGARGFQRIARALARRDSPLQSLIILFALNDPDQFLADFAAAFSSSPDSLPNSLTFSGLHICETGGIAFGSVLVRRMDPLEYLELVVGEDDHAGVVGVMALLQVLSNDPSKTCRRILFSTRFERFYNDFVEHIEAMLRNQTCSMEELMFNENDDDMERITDFNQRITSICCNKASIDATYFSNHMLRIVDGAYGACPKLEYYLTMNQNPNKKKVARGKVYDAYFARNFEPDFFTGMQPSLLSQVFPFVNQSFADHEELTSGAGATTDGNDKAEQATNNSLSIHFMLIKNHPSLFDHILVNEH